MVIRSFHRYIYSILVCFKAVQSNLKHHDQLHILVALAPIALIAVRGVDVTWQTSQPCKGLKQLVCCNSQDAPDNAVFVDLPSGQVTVEVYGRQGVSCPFEEQAVTWTATGPAFTMEGKAGVCGISSKNSQSSEGFLQARKLSELLKLAES